MTPALRHVARPLLAGVIFLFGAAQAQAPGDVRLALVIGNAAYEGPGALANPANDAVAMGNALRGLGFEVIQLKDGKRADMLQAIDKVREGLKGRQGIGMMYYAGHGMQLDWRNYMVPVDAKLQSAADVPAQAVDVSGVMEAFKLAGTRMNILVLDACRDNPFKQATSGKGLAQLDAPPSTILAYATAPGNVAEDGSGTNGLYTQFLLQELVKPQARIEDVFKRTRFAVRRASQGRQIPWESTSLEDDFMFNSGQVVAVPKPEERARDAAFTREKADWDTIKSATSAEPVFEFLQKYPNGLLSELAHSRLDLLARPQTVKPVERDGKVQVDAHQRFRDGDRMEFIVRDGLSGVETRAVSEIRIAQGEVLAQNTGMAVHRYTTAGLVLQDGDLTYDPPWATGPGTDFQVGKKWTARAFQTRAGGQRQWVEVEGKILARERISTALGEVNTYKVEIVQNSEAGARRKTTSWFDPEWGYAVKRVTEFRRPGASQAPEIQWREMVARSRKN